MTELVRRNFVGNDLVRLVDSMFPAVFSPTWGNVKLPYNVRKTDNGAVYEFALAGYRKDEISVELNGDSLSISAKKEKDDCQYYHRGLSYREFSTVLSVQGYEVSSDDVKFENGLLSISLKKVNNTRTLEIM